MLAGFPKLLACVAMSTCGWLWAWRLAATGESISARTVFVVAALARFVLVLPPVPLSDDLYRYLWDGRVANAGIDPFRWPPAAEELAGLRDEAVWPLINHPDVPTIYPPFAQLCFRALAALSDDPRGARVLAVVADLVTSALLAWLLRRRGRAFSLVVAHAWCPLAILETGRGGHIDAVGVALLIGALAVLSAAAAAGRAVGAGLLLGCSTLVKPVAIVLAPVLLSRRNTHRGALVVGVLAAMFLWIPYAGEGEKIAQGFLTYAEHWEFNDALYSPVVAAGVTPRRARLLLAACLALSIVIAARRARDPVSAAGPTIFTLFVCSPTVHPWYGLWLAAFLPLLPRWTQSGLATFCALLPISYATAWQHAASGIWKEPVWPRALLWGTTLAALILGAVRFRRVSE